MLKTSKVTIKLGQKVLDWVKVRADARSLTPAEYLRVLISDAHLADVSALQTPSQDRSGAVATTSEVLARDKLRPTHSGYKGVYAYGKRWQAVISTGGGGQQIRVGVYNTPEDAARAYDQALVERAGGDSRAAVNTRDAQLQAAAAIDRSFYEKLGREPLTDVELAAWKKASANAPLVDGPTNPNGPHVVGDELVIPELPPVRRQLRRGSAPAIDRPSEHPSPPPVPDDPDEPGNPFQG